MQKQRAEKNYFIVTYRNPLEEKACTLKARNIKDSGLGLSFICISDFLFDTDSVVVNPAEEALAKHFADVKNLHLSIYHIISIEEVGTRRKGLTFKQNKSNLTVLPIPPGKER